LFFIVIMLVFMLVIYLKPSFYAKLNLDRGEARVQMYPSKIVKTVIRSKILLYICTPTEDDYALTS